MYYQLTFCFQKFVDNAQQCFAFKPQENLPSQIWIFTEGDGMNPGYLLKYFLLYVKCKDQPSSSSDMYRKVFYKG